MAPLVQVGARFHGAVQLQTPQRKVSQQNIPFWNFTLELASGRYPARAFLNEAYRGPEELVDGQPVHLNGQWGEWNGRLFLLVTTIAPIQTVVFTQNRESLRGLFLLLNEPLQQFLRGVVRDVSLWPLWQSQPASTHHHHGYPGGLLQHSLEAAWSVMGQITLPLAERQVAAVAALLHDIGKIRCYTPEGSMTPLGQQVHHEALTLEVLAPHLAELDRQVPAIAIRLRRLLTLNLRHSRSDRIDELLVRQADHLSTLHALT